MVEKKKHFKFEHERSWLGVIILLFVSLVILVVLHYNSVYVPGPGLNEGPNCLPAPSYSCYKTITINEAGQLSGAFVYINGSPEYNISIMCISPSDNSYLSNRSFMWEQPYNFTSLTNGIVVNFVTQCYRPNGTILDNITMNTSVQGSILIRYSNSTTDRQTIKVALWFSSRVT